MEVTTKRYAHDHVSSYKNRGEKLGCSNRYVRAHRANEERKTSRLDELTKRRGLVLSLVNECNVSVEKNPCVKKTTALKAKDKTITKEKSSAKENVPQVTDERKAMLLKWREQRELKRKADLAKNQQKAIFAVRQVKYADNKPILARFTGKSTKVSPSKKPKPISVAPVKRVTRSSARLADKQAPVKPVTRSTSKKPTTSKKVEQESKRVTRTSVKAKSTAVEEKKVTNIDNQKNQIEDLPENSESIVSEKKATSLAKKKQERKSFAPPNFQFTAPSGLYSFEHFSKDFKFKPLSPGSTESFFKGVTRDSPTSENRRQLITKNNFAVKNNAIEKENSVPTADVNELKMEDNVSSNKKDVESRDEKNGEAGRKEVENKNNQLTSKYFRNLISSETEKLNLLCQKWEKEMDSENDLSEEVKGSIRTAIGQAQLLISQRFKQFSGLIDLSEDETAEKKATMSDLQGFWDMIYFQVEDVNSKMSSLENQKQNNWVVESKQVKTAAKKTKKNATTKTAANKTAKPGAKSKIQEMRAAMKAKMAEKKRQMSQDNESCSFITVLTPIKKNRKSAGAIILTPVRRSLRNTPTPRRSRTPRGTPKVISTPRRSSTRSPGLRLTPEVLTTPPSAVGGVKLNQEPESDDQENSEAEEKENENQKIISEAEIPQTTDKSEKENGCVVEEKDEDTKETVQVAAFQFVKRQSCLRSSTKKKRKSSRVFFQSPQSRTKSTAGGTPGPLVFTPGGQGNVRSTGAIFTPVAVSFDSPTLEGITCSLNAGHTPALVTTQKCGLRKRTSKGTPIRRSGRKHPQSTLDGRDMSSSDSAPDHSPSPEEEQSGTPLSCLDNEITDSSSSKRRSLRRSCRKSKPTEKDSFLPDKYILPSTSSEEECGDNRPAMSPVLTGNNLSASEQPLLAFTPIKDSSNQSNLTPATLLQALSLDDSLTVDNRRDSVFFAPRDPLSDDGETAKENLICFSPVAE